MRRKRRSLRCGSLPGKGTTVLNTKCPIAFIYAHLAFDSHAGDAICTWRTSSVQEQYIDLQFCVHFLLFTLIDERGCIFEHRSQRCSIRPCVHERLKLPVLPGWCPSRDAL